MSNRLTIAARAVLLTSCLAAAGCAAPFGVRRASPEAVYHSVNDNVLAGGELSNTSQIMLRRHNLTEAFAADPNATLAALRVKLLIGALNRDDLYSLAELSVFYAEHGGGRPHYLAAALYAYAYLFPGGADAGGALFDPRTQSAVDLYGRALTEAFRSADADLVDVAGGSYALPFGQIVVSFDEQQLLWGNRQLVKFTPAADVEVIGFRNRYRQPGIGAPLAAASRPLAPTTTPQAFIVGPNVRVPVTMLLRIPDPTRQILGDQLTGDLELFAATAQHATTIDGRAVPLAQEPTAALALALNDAQPWKTELGRFLGAALQTPVTATALAGREPHRRGRIPVVLVHGTASNFSVWANLVNDLDTDPLIREHFEFWLFAYDSGQPILYSAMQLRTALTGAVAALQAEAPDPCLDDMVVIGHSQGGLLTKLTAVHSGDLFWRNISDEPFEQADMPEETRAVLKEVVFVEPLPFVRRVVFIATPQRGSYLAGPSLVRRLAQRLITFPAALATAGVGLLSSNVAQKAKLQNLPTSIDNMSPGHPFILAIAKIPVSPDVAVNSIIGATGDPPLEQQGDGVVKYRSAHIEGVESELIVNSEHSMQSKPEVIAEVQRILRLHLERNPCAADGDGRAGRAPRPDGGVD
ncbi:MAG: esterase/lipase family protein [Candidatus Binatia bacterium]